MKKHFFLSLVLSLFITSVFARQVTISLDGERKEGTETSLTYNADGSVLLKADCVSVYGLCARATVEVGSRASDNPLPGDLTQFEAYDEVGNVVFMGTGHFVSQQTVTHEDYYEYQLTLTGFVQN